MYKRYEARHIFLVIGICILLFSPLIILLTPLLVNETLYFEKGQWVIYTPGVNYMLYGIGILFLLIACVVIYFFNVHKVAVGIGIVCTIVCGVLFYGASLSYVTISAEEISLRKSFSREIQNYRWEEIDHLMFYDRIELDNERGYYEFYFKDGKMLYVLQTGYFTQEITLYFDRKVREKGILFEHITEY